MSDAERLVAIEATLARLMEMDAEQAREIRSLRSQVELLQAIVLLLIGAQ